MKQNTEKHNNLLK